jgi:DNA polymerase IIIc chi subunit
MTKVDFYLLGSDGDSRERIACRLAEKAWRLGNRVYLLAPDKAAAHALDDLLWTSARAASCRMRCVRMTATQKPTRC